MKCPSIKVKFMGSIEVGGSGRKGRPGYRRVDGYAVVTKPPSGGETIQYPWLPLRKAQAEARVQAVKAGCPKLKIPVTR